MNNSEVDISRIVSEVIEKIKKNGAISIDGIGAGVGGDYGIFENMEDAINSAHVAFAEYRNISLEKRYEIIEAIREVSRKNMEKWAKMAQSETGMGRVADKMLKNKLVIEKTPGPEVVKPEVETGDRGLTLTERAPFGVIAAITPSTNPAATIINNSISFLSGGNVVVYNFHPAAKGVCADAVREINKAIQKVGAPKNVITAVGNPTIDSGNYMMRHEKVRLVVVTGGPAVVEAAFKSGKKVICAGPGNPPVVVDETADLEHAAKQIVLGASFDNNLLCIAEKELFAVGSVMDRLISLMEKEGAYVLNKDELLRLMKVVLADGGHPNKRWVGKDARLILNEIGVRVDDSKRLIICEVGFNHPFVQRELLMPILPLVRTRGVDEAIDMAVRAEHGFGHTAMMYSKNIESLHKMARAVNTSIFVKNGASVSGLGYEGEGSTTMTIASPTGEGCTDARTFTRLRRCVLKDYFRIV